MTTEARDVVFTLKAVTDPNSKKAFEELAAMLAELEKRAKIPIGGGGGGLPGGGGGGPGKPGAEVIAGRTMKEWEKISRGMDKEMKAQQRSVEEAAKKQSEALDKAANQVAAANARMANSFDRSLEGLVKLGRGFAMMGLVGEENLRKLTDGLLKLQAASDVIRGGKDLIGGVTGMTSAGRLAGAAGGGGLAAGAASLTGPVLAAAAALAALAAAAQLASEKWNGTSERADSFTDTIGQWDVSIRGFLDTLPGVAAFVNKFATDEERIDMDAIRGARESGKSFDASSQASAKALADRRQFDLSTSNEIRNGAIGRATQQRGQDLRNQLAVERSGTGLTDNDKAGLLNEQSRLDIVEELRATEAAMLDAKKGGIESERKAAEDHLAAAERALALNHEQLGIVKQEKAERLSGLRDALTMQETLSKKAISQAKELARATMSDAQRFADLDAEQRKQLVEAVAVLRKGGKLTKEQADLTSPFEEFRNETNVNRANQGFAAAEPFGLLNAGRDRAARAAQVAEKEQDKKLKIEQSIDIVLESKVDEQSVIDAMQPLIEVVMNAQKQVLEKMEKIAAAKVQQGQRGVNAAIGAVVR